MTVTMKKYADVVRAYLDGAEVQVASALYPDTWNDCKDPTWVDHCLYRIKPKESRIVERYIPVGFNGCHHVRGVYRTTKVPSICEDDINYSVIANIKLRCNEETGEVLSVELIKENK